MSSISSTSDRSVLLAEARAEWLQRAETKFQTTGAKVPATPTDTELISEDALLAKEIQAAEASATAVTKLATTVSVLA